MRRTIDAPARTRVSTSRPKLSVPNVWAALGGWRSWSKSWVKGSYGLTRGPITPAASGTSSIAPPTVRLIWMRRRAGAAIARSAATVLTGRPGAGRRREPPSGSSHPNPRVEQGIDQVRGEVDQHDAEREGQGQRLNHHVVAGEDGLDHPRAEAGQREHALDDDRAADDVRQPYTDERDDRQQRRAQDVAKQHRAPVEPLRAGEVDVRGRLHVDQRRAQVPDQHRGE